MEIDLTTVAGLAAAAWALTSVLVWLCKDYGLTADAQKLIAIVVALVLGLVVYFAGIALQNYNPVELILQIILGAIGAGVGHDKIAKPIKAAVVRTPP